MDEEELHRLRPLVEAGMDMATADVRAGLGALLREVGRPALRPTCCATRELRPRSTPERSIPR